MSPVRAGLMHVCVASFCFSGIAALSACGAERQSADTGGAIEEVSAVVMRREPVEQVSEVQQVPQALNRHEPAIPVTSKVRQTAVTATTETPKEVAPVNQDNKGALQSKPELLDIEPSKGPAGLAYPISATVRGRGFMPTGNVVIFGPVTIQGLPSTDGATIRFQVPKGFQLPGGAPPAVLGEGEYWVTVTTPGGTSNWVVFTFTRDP